MNDDTLMQIRSGGRRIELYAEVGKYFSADGKPDEASFRRYIRTSLDQIGAANRNEDDFGRESASWLSSCLERITGYLREKGLNDEALLLFRAAIEEAAARGVRSVTVPADQLQLMLSQGPVTADAAKEKANPPANRTKIFDAALQLFVEKGFHNTTVDEIATLSNVGKGTVYRNFKTKEDLLDQMLKEKTAEIVSVFSNVLSSDQDILVLVEKTISMWLGFIEDNYLLYRLIQQEDIAPHSGRRAMLYNTIVSQLPMLKERVVALNARGKLKTTSFYTAFYGMLGFIDGVFHKWLRSGRDYSLRDELPVILEVLFNGFVGEKASNKRFFVPPEEKAE